MKITFGDDQLDRSSEKARAITLCLYQLQRSVSMKFSFYISFLYVGHDAASKAAAFIITGR